MNEWIDHAGDAGERFGFADLLIASLAAESGSSIWSLDNDFVRMERLGCSRVHCAGDASDARSTRDADDAGDASDAGSAADAGDPLS